MHKEAGEVNRAGWNKFAYEAWIKGKGTPEQIAADLINNPWRKLEPFRPYVGQFEGKRVANLLGSYGNAAVAMALLGAEVTVVDISEANARFANELAQAAGVRIDYIVSDVMELSLENMAGSFDIVLMELGILHWMMDLKHFFSIVSALLKKGGRVFVRDFHPIKTKLLKWEVGKMVASRNYFDSDIHEGDVPYKIFLSEEEQAQLTKVRTRVWTLGEIITSMAGNGFVIQALHEESGPSQRWMFPQDAPSGIEDRMPAIYTIVADRT